MFRRNLFHLWFGMVILPCMILVGPGGCGDDDGNGDTTDGNGDTTPPRDRIVFVKRGLVASNLGSLSTADFFCQSEANSCGLAGSTFYAWISFDPSQHPSTRFAKDGRFRLVDGTIVADDWADLTDGRLDAPINIDCRGQSAIGLSWTGTSSDGDIYNDLPCQSTCCGWTSYSSADYAITGGISSPTGWSDGAGKTSCAEWAYLYCFEQ